MAKIVSNSLNSRRIIAMTLIGICVMATVVSLTSARYLPTRSDDSRRERIKEVLRLLLDMPSAANDDYGSMRAYDYQTGGGAAISKRDTSSPLNVIHHNN